MNPYFKSILFGLVLLFITQVNAQHQNVSSDVYAGFVDSETVPCIFSFQDQWKAPSFIKNWTKEAKGQYVFDHLYQHAQKQQHLMIQFLQEQKISFKAYYIFNGILAEVNQSQFDYIMEHYPIHRVAYDKSFKIAKNKAQSLQKVPTEWGIQRIKADSVWLLGYEGENVVIAGQDTGYDFDNPLLVDKYRGYDGSNFEHNYNWHDAIHTLNPLNNDPDENPENNPCGLDSPIPCDDHGHGTHTMGTMVGQDADNGIGVAPKAQWISCRNMERGWGMPSSYTECFEWFLAPTNLAGQNPDPSLSPHVINNSWGCPEQEGCNEDNWMFMENVVDNLVAAGVVVVVSAGNDGGWGCGSINRPPSMFENTFVVGASAKNDSIAGFSSRGPVLVDGSKRIKPDVVAPGVGVRSITHTGEFQSWNGTSMAGPHVAGAVALIINANPALAGQVEEIEDILRNTAVHKVDSMQCDGNYAQEIPNFVYGYGRIDVYEAVKQAQFWVGEEIVEKEERLISLYPNPSNGMITIKGIEYVPEDTKIVVYNMQGKVVFTDNISTIGNTMNLRFLPKAMYQYKIEAKDFMEIGRFIIQ